MKRTSLVIAAVATLGLGGAALAANEPDNLIKYRQTVMRANGAHLAALNSLVKGEVAFPGDVAEHARSLNEMGKTMGDPFVAAPTDNTKYKTRAKPEIWSNMDDFKKQLATFQGATANLVKISQGNDTQAMAQAVAAVGQACGSCHKPYRAEQ